MIEIDVSDVYYPKSKIVSETGKAVIFNKIYLKLFQSSNSLALFGINGAGKTTLIKALFSFEAAYTGEVTYKIDELKYNKKQVILNNLINNVGPELFYPDLPVSALIQLVRAFNPKLDIDQLYRITNLAQIPPLSSAYASLSSGEKRKFHVALGLASWNKINIFDEALANLDGSAINLFSELIAQKLADNPSSNLIFITHNPKEALLFDEWIFLEKTNSHMPLVIMKKTVLNKIRYFSINFELDLTNFSECYRVREHLYCVPQSFEYHSLKLGSSTTFQQVSSILGSLAIVEEYYKLGLIEDKFKEVYASYE